jgi:prophage regulatory protein
MTSDTKRKARPEQPLHALQIADALLKLRTVQALTGLGKTSLYARIKSGEFKPVHLGTRCTRFRAADVQAWLQAQGREVAP